MYKITKKKEPTYPISRFLTNPFSMGAIGGGIGVGKALYPLAKARYQGRQIPERFINIAKKSALMSLVTGSLALGFVSEILRRVHARALKGRITAGKKIRPIEKEFRLK